MNSFPFVCKFCGATSLKDLTPGEKFCHICTGFTYMSQKDIAQIVNEKHDPVNHPSHYTAHPSGVECITVTRHMSFNLGNVIKYIWRADHKGSTLQDLEKALFYLKDEIALRQSEK